MLERAVMLLVWFYFMFSSGSEYDMNGSILEKIANVFRIIGTIAGAIWSVTCVVKELVSIPWGEWAENGVLEHIRELARGIMLFPFCVLQSNARNSRFSERAYERFRCSVGNT